MTEPAWKMNEQWLEYTAGEKDAGLFLEQVLKEHLGRFRTDDSTFNKE